MFLEIFKGVFYSPKHILPIDVYVAVQVGGEVEVSTHDRGHYVIRLLLGYYLFLDWDQFI